MTGGRATIAAGLLAVLCAAACDVQVGDRGVSVQVAHGRVEDVWTRAYTLPVGAAVDIEALDGTIEATAAPGRRFEVRIVRTVVAPSDADARQVLESVPIAETAGPDSLAIRTGGAAEPAREAMPGRVSVTCRLSVPEGLTIALRTGHGGIQMDGLVGRISAAAAHGGISGRNLAGAIDLATVNGGIQLSLRSVDGRINMASVNGGIRIEMPAEAGSVLDASVINGTISIDESLPLAFSQQLPLHVAGTFGRGGPGLSIQTTNGGIRIVGPRPGGR